MKCPQCKAPADVLDSRPHKLGRRRRYLCFNMHRFSTMETVVQFKKEKRDAQRHLALRHPEKPG